MQRPDLATLACVNADCQHYGRLGQGNLTIRKVYGQDGIRLLRCQSCHEEFSERRHTALFNTEESYQAGDYWDHTAIAPDSNSSTSGRAGGLKDSEPLKAACQLSRLKAACGYL